MTAGAFTGGLACAFAVFGAAGAMLMSAVKLSTGVYVLLAAALATGGVATLLKADACSGHRSRNDTGALSAGFLMGASSAFVVSPCCTPVLLAIAAYSAASGSSLSGAMLCAVYAAGHGLPLIFAALGAGSIGALLERFTVQRAAATVSGGIMLALAGYYGVIA
jgi:cytochrome c-type biogenesis protein